MAARADRQAERRRQILDAAVKVFARSGFHGARVGDIAEEAGVAYGLVYHYFKSKEDLLETIFRDTWTQMSRVREVEGSGVDASEQVRQVTALLLRGAGPGPRPRPRPRGDARSASSGNRGDHRRDGGAREDHRAGQETGEFRPQIDPRLGAVVFYGALDEILTGWVLGQLPDTDEDIAQAESNVVLLVEECAKRNPSRVPASPVLPL